jgi:hypothetical protein
MGFQVSNKITHALLLLLIQIFLAGSPRRLKRSSSHAYDYGVPSDVIWPSSVVPVSQAEPDRALGGSNAFIYRIPGEIQDISTQIAFHVAKDNDSNSFCMIGAYEMNALWGKHNVFAQSKGTCELILFAYIGDSPISPNDTWNQHPAVNYAEIIATGLVSYSLCFTVCRDYSLCGFNMA